ncbi:MAG: tripartite tricarboxylate transporter TctB family protein [Acidiferrobacterales bacterium]|nr:tripartite tricarboxylate transporter TctB family protein [Acidiferrobacterales bacterium]
MKLRPQALLSLFITFLAAWAAYEATSWDRSARLFPLLASLPLLVLSLIQLGIDTLKRNGETAKTMDFEFTKGVEEGLAQRRTLNIFAWLFGFAFAIWLLGFHIAIPLTVLLYLKVQGRERWSLSLGLTVLIYVLFWAIFDHLLHLPFPEPVILAWMEGL